MASAFARAGPVLVLLGGLAVAFGFVLEYSAEYLLLTRIGGPFGASYETYAQLAGISLFLIGAGAVVAGVGWSLSQLAPRASLAPPMGPGMTRTVVAISLVLIGASLIAAGSWFEGVGLEYSASGINLHLPIWTTAVSLLFAGLGLALWTAGWFSLRWPGRVA